MRIFILISLLLLLLPSAAAAYDFSAGATGCDDTAAYAAATAVGNASSSLQACVGDPTGTAFLRSADTACLKHVQIKCYPDPAGPAPSLVYRSVEVSLPSTCPGCVAPDPPDPPDPVVFPDCDDHDPCTFDILIDSSCRHYPKPNCDSGGPCQEVGCPDDGDPCTDSRCLADGSCDYIPISGCAEPCTKASDCSDGDSCTDDVCVNFFCRNLNNGTPGCAPNCLDTGCDDDDVCTDDHCNTSTGKCTYSVTENAVIGCKAGCSSVDECVTGDPCLIGTCESRAADGLYRCVQRRSPDCLDCETAKDCQDGDPCTDNVCINGKCKSYKIVDAARGCADSDVPPADFPDGIYSDPNDPNSCTTCNLQDNSAATVDGLKDLHGVLSQIAGNTQNNVTASGKAGDQVAGAVSSSGDKISGAISDDGVSTRVTISQGLGAVQNTIIKNRDDAKTSADAIEKAVKDGSKDTIEKMAELEGKWTVGSGTMGELPAEDVVGEGAYPENQHGPITFGEASEQVVAVGEEQEYLNSIEQQTLADKQTVEDAITGSRTQLEDLIKSKVIFEISSGACSQSLPVWGNTLDLDFCPYQGVLDFMGDWIYKFAVLSSFFIVFRE